MKLTKAILLIVTMCMAVISHSQQSTLHWYRLRSIVPMTEAQGKEALAIIRNHTTDSISSFTDKSNTFKLATTTAVDMDALTDLLNDEGYYIADVTHGGISTGLNIRSSEGFQHVVLLEKDAVLFASIEPTKIILYPEVYDELNETQRALVVTNQIFVVKGE
ncbi:MAG: hypothetical protein ACKVOR_03585 [Flavobacteriales bacterium]